MFIKQANNKSSRKHIPNSEFLVPRALDWDLHFIIINEWKFRKTFALSKRATRSMVQVIFVDE